MKLQLAETDLRLVGYVLKSCQVASFLQRLIYCWERNGLSRISIMNGDPPVALGATLLSMTNVQQGGRWKPGKGRRNRAFLLRNLGKTRLIGYWLAIRKVWMAVKLDPENAKLPEKVWQEKNSKGMFERGESSDAFETMQLDETTDLDIPDLVEHNQVNGQKVGSSSGIIGDKNHQADLGVVKSMESDYDSSNAESDMEEMVEEDGDSGESNSQDYEEEIRGGMKDVGETPVTFSPCANEAVFGLSLAAHDGPGDQLLVYKVDVGPTPKGHLADQTLDVAFGGQLGDSQAIGPLQSRLISGGSSCPKTPAIPSKFCLPRDNRSLSPTSPSGKVSLRRSRRIRRTPPS